MLKQDFLDILRNALSGHLGTSELNENLNYYEGYINAQVRQGRSEEEVLVELGDPRLIARSIKTAAKHADNNSTGWNQAEKEPVQYENWNAGKRSKVWRLPLWLTILLSIVIVLALVVIAAVFLWWIAPLLLFVWLIVMAVRVLSNKY